jgi:hypothetical protein
MANIDLTLGGTTGISEQSARKHILFTNTIDFSGTHKVNDVDVSNALLSTDIGQLINIPAKFWMTMFGIRLDTVQGATCTAVFGDGANADGWLATAVDLDGTADDFFQSGLIQAAATPDTFLDLYHPGKYYPAADTIDIDPANTVDAAIITVWCAGFLLN